VVDTHGTKKFESRVRSISGDIMIAMDNAKKPGKPFVGTVSELLEAMKKSVEAMSPEEKAELRAAWSERPSSQTSQPIKNKIEADDKTFLEDCGIKSEKLEKEELR
jgi:hypothetical protein